jgi:small-conductance mechanosensitive channel
VKLLLTAVLYPAGDHVAFAFLLLLGLLSIWFDDPGRLATGLGLVTARVLSRGGPGFALQKVITTVASHFVLRGGTFSVRDRITMGGVRGNVIELGFIKATIMEMGQRPCGLRSCAVGEEPASTRGAS